MTTTEAPPAAAVLHNADHPDWGRIGPWSYEIPDGADTRYFEVWHDPDVTLVACLPADRERARAYILSGNAQADLGRLLAHERGEHDGAVPFCGRC